MALAKIYYGTVFPHGSATLLARVVGHYSEVLKRSEIQSGTYSVTLMDENNPEISVNVTGHTNVSLDLDTVFFNTLRRDSLWSEDRQGYNFRHVLTPGQNDIFTRIQRMYQIEYRFQHVEADREKIIVQFRLFVV